MEIYYQPELGKRIGFLSEEESKHCIRVLRHKVGDKILIVDGKGLKVEAEITVPKPKKCEFKVLTEYQPEEKQFVINIAIAPTKNIDRIEWFIEKTVEIGIDKIDFYYSKNSERRKLNLERLAKKAIVAMKQSGQAKLPEIGIHNSLEDLIKTKKNIDQHFIAYVDFENPSHLFDSSESSKSSLVLIGPEGDFTKDELQLALDSGYRKVSLGNNRLRTETAAVAACHILNLVNR